MRVTGGAERVVTDSMGRTLLRVGEAAAVLSVSRWTIYRWVEEGRLRATKIGKGSLRIFRESIVGLIESSESNVSDPSLKSERS